MNIFLKKDYYYRPRWSVMTFDLILIGFIMFLSSKLIIASDVYLISTNQLIIISLITGLCYLIGYLIIRPYKGIIRHFSINDIVRFTFAHVIGSSILIILNFLDVTLYLGFDISFPYVIIIIHFFISIFSVIFSRITLKYIDKKNSNNVITGKNILIYCTGKLALLTKEAIMQDTQNRYNIVGFIDSNPIFKNRKIAGIPVFSEEIAFSKVVKNDFIEEIVIAADNNDMPSKKKKDIIDKCFQHKILIKEVPMLSDWFEGALNPAQIKEVNVEDLLGREPIILEKNRIKEGLCSKKLLVTGAAGSIGSEIVRQLINFNSSLIILVDFAESALFNIQNEIKEKSSIVEVVCIIADTRDLVRMEHIFNIYKPEIVYHASAYKHVPLMEANPYEAVRNNILSVKIISDLSVKYKVNKFIMISTDKAVKPTNIMGATKRICEIYTQALSSYVNNQTEFITTRFGNVLGSNGSVVPIFKKQIQSGGPITITHKEIIRYFMTIPEACQLVLEASFMGKGGEIYIFDMGQPVKIYDLAEKMIFLSGYIPHKDIQIKEIGLRPGEKLYEELLNDRETTIQTHNKRIMIAKTYSQSYEQINTAINELINGIYKCSERDIVLKMKEIVSDFISSNSEFESLDVNINK